MTAQFADSNRDRFSFGDVTSGSRGDRIKGSYETTFKIDTGSVRHALTFAADGEREGYRNVDPSGFAFVGRQTTDNVGLVGQYRALIGDDASVGASVRRDLNNRFADTTTFRIDGSYRLPTATRLRAAYGTGVKNPGFFELFGYVDGRYIGNPGLKPERSEGYEVGAEQSVGGDAVVIGATWFDSRLKDEIFTTYPAPDFVATPANRTTRSKQQGVEAFVQARLTPAWRVDASYTRLTAREDGVEEVRRPRDIASVAIGWRAPEERGGVTLVARYTGRQRDFAFIDPSFVPVTVTLNDYTLVNLNADAKLTDRLSLYARVENLLDESYEDVFSFTNPGRAAYAGLKVRL